MELIERREVTHDPAAGSLWLALLDCSGIQDYVFGSNRLTDNIGGSYLVESALTSGLEAALAATLGAATVVADWPAATKLTLGYGDDQSVTQAEVLYYGGGNAVVLFKNERDARATLAALGDRLLSGAPGLRVSASLRSYTPRHGAAGEREPESEPIGLAAALRAAHRDLNRRKLADERRLVPTGHPIVRACRVTGLPASYPDHLDPPGRISTVAEARRRAGEAGNARLRQTFPSVLEQGFAFPLDLDKLGQQAGESHVAVVHADGNGLGKALMDLLGGATDDQQVAKEVRAFSKRVADGAVAALAGMIDRLLDVQHELERDHDITYAWRDSKTRFLPLRPIVYGGDDVTFVCEGRLGLQLAAHYLELFAEKTAGLTACAGVAIVGTGFPFSRAYRLAAELCASAKQRRLERQRVDTSWLDFHVALGGMTSTVSSLRQRDFGWDLSGTDSRPRVIHRPWRVTPWPDSGNMTTDDLAWLLACFAYLTRALAAREEDPAWSRTRLKGLRDAIERGRASAERYLGQVGARGATLGPFEKGLNHGFAEATSPLFDVLEVLDFIARPLLPDGQVGSDAAMGPVPGGEQPPAAMAGALA